MPELPDALTPIQPAELARALTTAAAATGLTPTVELLGVLMAQCALETGALGSAGQLCRAYNLGNAKATDKWISGGGSYCFYTQTPPHAPAPVTENLTTAQRDRCLAQARPRAAGGEGLDMVVAGQNADGSWLCYFWASHEQTRFRAFESLVEGAASWLSLLAGRYRAALGPAARGDVDGYVRTIHALKYFTADPEEYAKGVRYLYKKYLPVARAAMAGPFDHLPDTGALVSDPADVVLHSAGWLELESGVKVAKLAVYDERHQLFARLDATGRRAWLKAHGLRLAAPAELEERHRRGVHVKFRPRVFTAADALHMASHRWCAEADASLLQDAVAAGWDGSQAIDNPKTWCQPEGAIIGLWKHAGDNPAKDQQLSLFHASDPKFVDYATLLVPAQDSDEPAPVVVDIGPPDTLDPALSHGERAAAWAIARVGIAEKPPGSNRGPEVSAWLKPCQRDGYGPEFGQYLAAAGANWCAAFGSAAHAETRLPEDPPTVHGYRCSGLELENDAKAAGAWRDVADALNGTWVPAAGDLAIYKSGSQAWRRHVVLVAEAEESEFRGIGGNEGNKVTDATGRRFDHPQLLGFVELPRAEELAGDWAPLKRAVELERGLWQGVVGMDAFDELLAELAETDPRDDGEEEVLC